MDNKLEQGKIEMQKQRDKEPCGAVTVQDCDEGKKGYRRLVSEIEYRSSPDSSLPIEKVRRGEAARMFGMFKGVRMRTCHVEPAHKIHLAFPFRKMSGEALEPSPGSGRLHRAIKARKE